MNRRELVRHIATAMRENNIRKPISSPKHVFHISDDEGNTKDFIIKKTDKTVMYTIEDIDAVLDACLSIIEDSLKRGEPVTIRGFGTLGLRYRKARKTRGMISDEWVDVAARYVPKFSFGDRLRFCAKMYELSLQDGQYTEPLPVFDEDGEGDSDE